MRGAGARPKAQRAVLVVNTFPDQPEELTLLGNYEEVRVGFCDVQSCHPVVAAYELTRREQALHLEVLVLERLVHRTRVEAAPPLARRLLLHWKKG